VISGINRSSPLNPLNTLIDDDTTKRMNGRKDDEELMMKGWWQEGLLSEGKKREARGVDFGGD